MQIPGISDIVVWSKDIAAVLRLIMDQARAWLVKALPYVILPSIFLGEAFAIFTNEDAWLAINEALNVLEGGVAAGGSGLAPWLSRMNYVFPMTETFLMALVLANLAIASVALRLIKAVIEFILEIIPF
jgi:hypothetical protein